MGPNGWLLMMVMTYAVVIVVVWNASTREEGSISEILCKDHIFLPVALGMMWMSLCTVIYESKCANRPFFPIAMLLAALLGVLAFPVDTHTTPHYVCAFGVVMAILFWSFSISSSFPIVRPLWWWQATAGLLLLLTLGRGTTSKLFLFAQSAFLLCFAVTYMAVHFEGFSYKEIKS